MSWCIVIKISFIFQWYIFNNETNRKSRKCRTKVHPVWFMVKRKRWDDNKCPSFLYSRNKRAFFYFTKIMSLMCKQLSYKYNVQMEEKDRTHATTKAAVQTWISVWKSNGIKAKLHTGKKTNAATDIRSAKRTVVLCSISTSTDLTQVKNMSKKPVWFHCIHF